MLKPPPGQVDEAAPELCHEATSVKRPFTYMFTQIDGTCLEFGDDANFAGYVLFINHVHQLPLLLSIRSGNLDIS